MIFAITLPARSAGRVIAKIIFGIFWPGQAVPNVPGNAIPVREGGLAGAPDLLHDQAHPSLSVIRPDPNQEGAIPWIAGCFG